MEQQATTDGMPEYEADASNVRGAMQAGGGVFVGNDVTQQQTTDNTAVAQTTAASDEDATPEREFLDSDNNGAGWKWFEYLGERDEVVTRYGTYRPGEVYRLPGNKADTVLQMQLPNRNPAFGEVDQP